MKLWIGRNFDYLEDPTDRGSKVQGELRVFFDKPEIEFIGPAIGGRRVWGYARLVAEVPKYMFPEIKSGELYEFESGDLPLKKFSE